MARNLERSTWLKVYHLLADLMMTAVSFSLAFILRTEIRSIYFFGSAQSVHDYYGILAVILPIWWFLLYTQKAYEVSLATPITKEFGLVVRTSAFGLIILFVTAYAFRLDMPPRSTSALFFMINCLLLCTNRMFFRSLREYQRFDAGLAKKILVVGSGEKAARFIASMQKLSERRIEVIGFIDFDRANVGKNMHGANVLAGPDGILDVLHSHVVDEVIFAVPTRQLEECADMLAVCEQEGVQAVILSNFFSSLVAQIHTEILYDQPVLVFSTTRHKVWQLVVKRLFDLFFSALCLLLILPVLLIIVVLIKLQDGGPVLFWQTRVGQNGVIFRFPKFRSMVLNADQMKEKLLAQNEMKGAVFKIKNDPRVTRLGRILRKFSLDELPQLWSVFRGDMSIVGPRPPLESELPRFDSWHRRKLSVRPGLTCLWQISGRSSITDFDEWVKLDLAYIDNWTLLLDFKILVKTIPAVLLGRGAH